MAIVLTTPRLTIRELLSTDAAFLLELLNEPDFIRYIADRQVRTIEQAELYLQDGPQSSYRQHGFGLWLVERQADGVALGVCGLLQREYLNMPDLGYAMLARYSGQGYASEAALAVLRFAHQQLGYQQLCAIVSPDNAASLHILQQLGMQPCGELSIPATGKTVCYLQWQPVSRGEPTL
jgi:RimJ/RimL family protein N-acetyltransferase